MVSPEQYPTELPPHVVDAHINTLLGKAGLGGTVEIVRGGAAIVVRASDNTGKIVASGMGQNVFEPLDIAATYGAFDVIPGGEKEFRQAYTERAHSLPESPDRPVDTAVLSALNTMVMRATDVIVSRIESDEHVIVDASWLEVAGEEPRQRSETAIAKSFTTAFAKIVELR